VIPPHQLIGMSYRLGSSPERHGTADCFSLSKAVLTYHGFSMPPANRDWYRRLRRKDYAVFEEELERWGAKIIKPRLGSLGLCLAENGGYGLAAWWEDGWLSFVGSAVSWSPIDSLEVVAFYSLPRQTSATPSG